MSLNIQTATGLLEIGGKVTKEKVISALEYEPADKVKVAEHTEDAHVHVSAEDRANWGNKDYNALENTPNLTDDGSGELTIVDNNGNAIAKFDADGLTTTNVNANTIKLNGEDLGVRLDELESVSLPNILDNESENLTIADKAGNIIMQVDASGVTTTGVNAETLLLNGENIGTKIDEHVSNKTIHVTAAEKESWDNKSDFSGDYNDLTNKPNIADDGSDRFVIADNAGNVVMTVDDNGLSTTNVNAKTIVLDGQDVAVALDVIREDLDSCIDEHNADEDAHASLFADVVTATNGGTIIANSAIFGEGPYVIEFTDDDFGIVIGGGTSGGTSGSNTETSYAVRYDKQTLTSEQKAQARENIGSASAERVEELFTSVSNGKALVASAITDKGVPTANDATFATIAANISAISREPAGTPDDALFFSYSEEPIKLIETALKDSNWWSRICYGNGVFVSLKEETNIAVYSTDGINWTETQMPTDTFFWECCFGGDKFVVSGEPFLYSTDGINWNETPYPSSDPDDYWGRICYGDGKFVAHTWNNNHAAYSTDGINWTVVTLPIEDEFTSVSYVNGKFIIMGSWSCAFSDDGIEWTASQRFPDYGSHDSGVVYINGNFVAPDSWGGFIYSEDCINWTFVSEPLLKQSERVVYGDNKAVVITANSDYLGAYSNDGITWYKIDSPVVDGTTSWREISYANNKFFAINEYNDIIIYSENGIDWIGTIKKGKLTDVSGNDVTAEILPYLSK